MEERQNIFDGASKVKYDFVIPFCKNKKVLDIGGGYGFGSKFIADSVSCKIVCMDYSRKAIKFAKKNNANLNIEFIHADVLKTSAGKIYDVIIAFDMIEHVRVEDCDRLLKYVVMSLKQDGVFFISTPNILTSSPNRIKSSNPYHKKEFHPDEFEYILSKYFSYVEMFFVKRKCPLSYEWSIKQKVVDFVCRFKIIHEVLCFIPQFIKNVFVKHKILKKDDFIVTKNDTIGSEFLLTYCKK